jgi:uncharacterized paraquat-inducible protein A
VAWCDTCIGEVADDTIGDDGCCPRCGSILVAPARQPVKPSIWFMLAASVVYLGYRCYQGISWVSHHVH